MAAENRYAVDVRRGGDGWSVAIVDPAGHDASVRACRDETDALTYASTVRQHIYWLSEQMLREYYRLPEPTEGA
ncbi:MAG TPA: hypothetical protein VLE71_04740 [Actinomycetota bacterium]|nr:hypothetical protein [Actinomycetota bacterium]